MKYKNWLINKQFEFYSIRHIGHIKDLMHCIFSTEDKAKKAIDNWCKQKFKKELK